MEWAEELDIRNVDQLAVETLRCVPTPHFVESPAFFYALQLLIPRYPTFGAIL